MHYATMSLLIAIAALGLHQAYTAPRKIGHTPKLIKVGDGLRTMVFMSIIIVWLALFGLDHSHDWPAGPLSAALVFERGMMLIRFSGLIEKTRKVMTWKWISFLMFWQLTEIALVTALLVLTW